MPDWDLIEIAKLTRKRLNVPGLRASIIQIPFRVNSMKKILTLLVLVLAVPVFAKPFNDKANKFKVSYPDGWKADTKAEHFKVLFKSPDETANIGVAVVSVDKPVGAVDFLAEVEKQMGVENIMGQDERQLEDDANTQVGADDGAMGVFMRGKGESQLRQIMFIFTKGVKIYTVIITFNESDKETYRQLTKDVMNSFQIQ